MRPFTGLGRPTWRVRGSRIGPSFCFGLHHFPATTPIAPFPDLSARMTHRSYLSTPQPSQPPPVPTRSAAGGTTGVIVPWGPPSVKSPPTTNQAKVARCLQEGISHTPAECGSAIVRPRRMRLGTWASSKRRDFDRLQVATLLPLFVPRDRNAPQSVASASSETGSLGASW